MTVDNLLHREVVVYFLVSKKMLGGTKWTD